jgi:hypothetical protein
MTEQHVPTFEQYQQTVTDKPTLAAYRALYGVQADKGWWFPSPVGKAHWADHEGRSLCGRWGSIGVPAAAFENDGGSVVSTQECVACRRALNARLGAK